MVRNRESLKQKAIEHNRNRESLKQKAVEHNNLMIKCYNNYTADTINRSIEYNHDFMLGTKSGVKSTKFFVDDLDTVSAIFKYNGTHLTVLNFASYKYPGGGFMWGSRAQEECLCHESNLYNVLSDSRFDKFYSWNRSNLNKSLYINRGIFTPDIMFERSSTGRIFANVITVAAPNKVAAMQEHKVTAKENKQCLSDRIRFILDIAVANKIDNLVLGAYGCGVFGQNPYEVSELFLYYLTTEFKGCFSNVIFAIPSGSDGNLAAFRSRFNGR